MRLFSVSRPEPRQKAEFIRGAQREVIEVGLALRTLVGYFEQRPSQEFFEPVTTLLRAGVNIRFLLLDPDSRTAEVYAVDSHERELLENIRRSIASLRKIREEFRLGGYAGAFDISVYHHVPSCYLTLVDPTEEAGRGIVAPYLYGIRRANTPWIEVNRVDDGPLLEMYHEYVQNLWADSRAV